MTLIKTYTEVYKLLKLQQTINKNQTSFKPFIILYGYKTFYIKMYDNTTLLY